jgi:hypothetical protein
MLEKSAFNDEYSSNPSPIYLRAIKLKILTSPLGP